MPGKTAIFTDFATRLKTIGKKTLIVVDRIELLKQTIKHNNTFGYLTSDSFVNGDVCVAMLQTLRARLKYEKYQEWLECFDFVFVDEIHQMANGMSVRLIQDFLKNEAVFIGVTATPWNDKGYLLEGFDEFINEVEIKDLIEQGYLVKPEHYTVDLFDFSNVKITKTEASTLNLEDYSNSVFSMKKPAGWKVDAAGMGMYYVIRVYDQNNSNNQIFLLKKILYNIKIMSYLLQHFNIYMLKITK